MLEVKNLGGGFADELGWIDGAAEEGGDEAGERGSEALAVGAEGGDGARGGDGGSVDEDEVAADAKRGVLAGEGGGFFEGGACGHEGGGGEAAGLIELDDGAVDAGGETEVVGVEDETCGHWVIVRGLDECR